MPNDSSALFPTGTAVFGPEEVGGRPVYRYLLTRELRGDGPPFVVVMVNPSTATAETNDATINRCIGFARRDGARRLVVANLFAYRATDVRTLRAVQDPVGPENDRHLGELARGNGRIIVAWGPLAKLPPHLRHRPGLVADRLVAAGASPRSPWSTRPPANLREHWAARARRVKAQRRAVAWFLPASLSRPALPVVVTLTRIGRGKLDGDNLQGAFKAVRDQVATWLGVDDADPRVRWEYEQRRGKACAVHIRVEGA